MQLEVYPDIIFFLNFFVDFILLFLLKKVNRKSSKNRRLIGAAATGALFAVFVSIYPWINVLLRFVLMNIIASIVMLLIAFGRMKKRELIKQMVALYLITYFAGGLLNSIYYHTNLRNHLINFGNALIFSDISWLFVIIMMLLLIPITISILWLYRWYKSTEREIYEVELFFNHQIVQTKGFMDTGNCLYDPIFKKPVMIIENSILERLVTSELLKDMNHVRLTMEGHNLDGEQCNIGGEYAHRIRFIPYQSIGKARGMMIGLILDKVLIHTDKETICNEKVTAAIGDNHLSTKDDYHVILHKELL